jgi:hypothetical protein
LAFEIALLHRRQGPVDDDQADFLFGDRLAKRLDPTLTDQGGRNRSVKTDDLAGNNVEVDRLSEADRLIEPRIERASGTVGRFAARRGLQGGMNDKGALGRRN